MTRLSQAFLLLVALVSAAHAQMSAEVQFEKGNYGTRVNGSITGDQYFDYKLGAGAGQQMFVELKVDATNGNGTVYFNVLPPNSDGVAIYNSSINGNSTTLTLPESGAYTIRVYLMGNDRDAGNTVGYNIDVSIQ